MCNTKFIFSMKRTFFWGGEAHFFFGGYTAFQTQQFDKTCWFLGFQKRQENVTAALKFDSAFLGREPPKVHSLRMVSTQRLRQLG